MMVVGIVNFSDKFSGPTFLPEKVYSAFSNVSGHKSPNVCHARKMEGTHEHFFMRSTGARKRCTKSAYTWYKVHVI